MAVKKIPLPQRGEPFQESREDSPDLIGVLST